MSLEGGEYMSFIINQDETLKETINIEKNNERLLFDRWIKNRDDEAANELVKKYMPLVQVITEKIHRTLPKSVSKEEIKSLGMIGLYEALEKYDPDRDLKFETYASFRIRGSILDGMRKEDWLPRKTREKSKKVEALIAQLEQKYLRNVSAEEIAKEADMSVEEIQSLLDDRYFSAVLSIDENAEQGENDSQTFVIKDEKMKNPEEEILYLEKIKELTLEISKLSDKEQLVLSLIYKEELSLTEIGQILGLSTSRISQIHSKALLRLRSLLTN